MLIRRCVTPHFVTTKIVSLFGKPMQAEALWRGQTRNSGLLTLASSNVTPHDAIHRSDRFSLNANWVSQFD